MELNIVIEYTWKHIGTFVTWADLLAKSTGPYAAVYRWTIETEHGSKYYIGESINFSRRMRGYAKPGPTQMTNIRLNEILNTSLAKNMRVDLDILDIAKLTIGDSSFIQEDLRDNYLRKMIENLMICREKNGDNILNL